MEENLDLFFILILIQKDKGKHRLEEFTTHIVEVVKVSGVLRETTEEHYFLENVHENLKILTVIQEQFFFTNFVQNDH